jgi:protein O-mannosyl-transferase
MKRLGWLPVLLLALLPYVGALHDPLLYDDRTLLDNRWLVTEAGPASVFTHDYWYGTKHESSDLYRPLTVLSLAWNMRYAGSREGIRLVNVLLHALAALTLLGLLRTICRKLGGNGPWPFFAAALFAVHPLASEAVLWAVGRAEILSAIFGMLAFGFLLEAIGEETHRRVLPALLSALFFLLALCSKESAVAWIAIVAAYLIVSAAWKNVPRRILAIAATGWIVALAGFLLLRGAAVGWTTHPPPFVDNPLIDAGAATRAANAVLLFARYLGKMFWPRTLSIEYGFDQIPVVPILPWAAIAALAIAAAFIAATVWLYRHERKTAAFLVLWVPAAFAVTGNLAFPIGTIFAERLGYLPLMGFCGLAGYALTTIPKRTWSFVALAVVVAAGTARTYARGADYRSLATLSEATAEASPRSVKALYNAARTRIRQGRVAEAIPLLERAVAIWPEYEHARELLEEARVGGRAGGAGEEEGR